MNPVLKLLLISLFLLGMVLLMYRVYTGLNDRIRGSQTGWALIGYVILMILANVVLLLGGLYLFLKIYVWLRQG